MSTDKTRGSAGINDLLVQLTGSAEDEFRLTTARRIAGDFDAHLIGVHLHELPDLLDIVEPTHSAMVMSLLENSEREADQSHARLATTFEAMLEGHELRRLHGLAADLGTDLATIARTVDLFVGTRPYGDPAAHYQIEEKVLFGGGRGCLFLPPGGSPHEAFETIVLAWNGSREAARAMAEAMPFLASSKMVYVATVGSQLQAEPAVGQLFDPVLAHLRHHGVEAEGVSLPFITGAGEQIEEFAHQMGADLIVTGAYGHVRMLEWVFGGATRYLLRHSTLPVLMAH